MITLKAPASKSVSHRMLIAASLARGRSLVHHTLSSAWRIWGAEAGACRAWNTAPQAALRP